jgi:hypothetical protein
MSEGKVVDSWLQDVADAKARGDQRAVNWLTACWMPFPESLRSDAKNGITRSAPPVGTVVESIVSTEPLRSGRIVFHPSALAARPSLVDSVDSTETSK